MSTVATVPKARGNRLTLQGVSWQLYESLLRQLGDRRLFLTYYRGTLEMMSPSYPHDRYSRLLFMLIEAMARHQRVPIISAGTTLRRKSLKVGLEADEAFYIKNAPAVRGLAEIDLAVHPPPDLAVEIEISRRLGKRKSAYQKLRIPEVWSFDGNKIVVRVLQSSGRYAQVSLSPTFERVELDEVAKFVREGVAEYDAVLIERFDAYLKSTIPTV